MSRQSSRHGAGSRDSNDRRRKLAAFVGALAVAVVVVLVVSIGCLNYGDYPSEVEDYLKIACLAALFSLFVLGPLFMWLSPDASTSITTGNAGFADWSDPPQLVELARFYERAKRDPESISDEEFLENIRRSSWPTNCGCFVEQAFARIAPGCALRPHLVRELIRSPIAAMIAGGLEDPRDVIAQGVACATKKDPYVKPNREGRTWLLNEWPKYAALVDEVFWEVLREMDEEG